MIKHFVIFTFEKDFFKEEHYKEYCEAFDKIKNAFDGIKDVKIHKNCVDRPANMDLMIEMDLEDESVLGQYLSYPEHVRMGEKYNPHVTTGFHLIIKCNLICIRRIFIKSERTMEYQP